jgi:zinc/manganese transport system substrate-binding protein
VLAAQGVQEDAEPSAKGIAALVRQIRREGIHTVFLESAADPRLVQALAREAGARVGEAVYPDTLSPPDGPAPTYIEMLRHNTVLFAASMAAS